METTVAGDFFLFFSLTVMIQKCSKFRCHCKHRCEWKNDQCIHCKHSLSFSFLLINNMFIITTIYTTIYTIIYTYMYTIYKKKKEESKEERRNIEAFLRPIFSFFLIIIMNNKCTCEDSNPNKNTVCIVCIKSYQTHQRVKCELQLD